jgi:hypothetical protein
MAKVTGPKTYGPYKGSKQNGGRKIVVKYDPKSQKTTSTNAARHTKEKQLGRKLRKDEHVDHKDNNKDHNGAKNLQVMKASDNIGKGNKHRKKKSK